MRTSAMRLDREMIKGRFADLEPRFLLLTIGVAALYSLIIWSMSGIPVPEPTESDIRHLQRQFALLVLKEEPVPDKKSAAQVKPDKESVRMEKRQEKARERVQGRQDRSAKQTRDDRHRAAMERARAREEAARAVAATGVLALISSVTAEASDDEAAVEDLLAGEGVSTSGLGKTLASLDGLKNSGNLRTGTRTSRDRRGDKSVTAGSGVEDLLSGIGTAQSLSLSRKTSVDFERPVLDRPKGDVPAGGSRETAEINRVIRRKLGAIQFCYKRELKQNPGLNGKITVRFSITPAGRVRDVKTVEDTIDSGSMQSCLLKTVTMLRFRPLPAQSGVTTVTYPFVFSG